MKQKKFKPSNNYRRDLGSRRGQGGGSKRKLIIGILIAVAVLLIAVAIIITVMLVNKNEGGPAGSNPGGTDIINPNVPSAPEKDEIVSIHIVQLPKKISYYCGEIFDVTGLEVYYLTKAEIFAKLDLSECQITGFDSSVAAEKQSITVKYEGFTDVFSVTIKEIPKPTPKLVSIAIETKPKTDYKIGDGLTSKGGVLLCTYSDGSTQKVDMKNLYVFGFMDAMNKGVGEYDLRVVYSENGIQVETTYKITITE